MTNLNGVVGTTRSFSRGRPIPAPGESLRAGDRLTARGIENIRRATAGQVVSIDPPFDRLPPEQQRWRLWALSQPKHFIAYDADNIGEEAEAIHAYAHSGPLPFGDLPLYVLCRDTTVEKSHDPLHVAHQQDTARRSRRGEFRIVPGAGHEIHLYAPDAVVQAIEHVMAETSGSNR